MKKWFTRLILISGFYDLIMAIVFIFATPLVSVLVNYSLTPLEGALLQIIGAFFLGFGIALVVASRSLDQLLIIPVSNIPARLIASIIVVYYVLVWGIPFSLIWFGIIDAVLAILFTSFILASKDYSFSWAFRRS
ncbi:MAG: hypothetical protein Q6364_03000 [Candidatus Hermodarchaeota archaeon]|nr:hypothetical protein [Candidatus Hermodarchaeota archaeon]